MINEVLSMLIRANKLGRQNIEVIGYAEPQEASQPFQFMLIIRIPSPKPASEREWYDN